MVEVKNFDFAAAADKVKNDKNFTNEKSIEPTKHVSITDNFKKATWIYF